MGKLKFRVKHRGNGTHGFTLEPETLLEGIESLLLVALLELHCTSGRRESLTFIWGLQALAMNGKLKSRVKHRGKKAHGSTL
jgi:hypothetical protein